MVDNTIKNKLRRNRQTHRVYAIEIDDDNADTIDIDDIVGVGVNSQDADGSGLLKFKKNSVPNSNTPQKRSRFISKRLPADEQESYVSTTSNRNHEQILSSSENDTDKDQKQAI